MRSLNRSTVHRYAIVFLGLWHAYGGGAMLWRAYADVAISPLGYMFSMLLGPPLLLIGIGLLLRRYWAGWLLAAFVMFGLLDWLTGPRFRGGRWSPGDAMLLAQFLFLTLSLSIGHQAWLKKL